VNLSFLQQVHGLARLNIDSDESGNNIGHNV